eukprot:CAMPEP_0201499240 /NCGR_PEP_ID=MMETSP0151_2-20130828/75108_1 /ASSEMBLY_ACC=CAM_ASM_000257 /TAXON_ID=200890 /ORGANISM="Paramoeba atlantica, Strain 621/1 / CCAP 1560/9" /LENGTH=67 /DNA_ID=CAMNT_0047891411 /DNA_START=28 /DNA_END=227 /DNA_ORIENTATION=-
MGEENIDREGKERRDKEKWQGAESWKKNGFWMQVQEGAEKLDFDQDLLRDQEENLGDIQKLKPMECS